MLREIRDLGFQYAELSHGIRISLLPGIFDAVDAGEIKISSLHNFCPLPMGVNHAAPNIYKFTAQDPRERENAYKHSLKTIDTAVRVGAKVVVLHMGAVDMKDYTDRLIEMIEKGERESSKYDKICQEVIEKREAKKERYQQSAYDMLRRLSDYAGERDIHLGIENREALEEIPFESDFGLFFREFREETVRYWHDTGHAQIKQHLGFIDHAIHLESMAEKLYGLHIHDVTYPGGDHQYPGSGTIDYQALKPFVKPEHVKVFELAPGMAVENVMKGVAHIKAIWGEE